MSVVAARRVESWWNGATRNVICGTPDSDNHAVQLETHRKFPKNRFL
jgi:hypothetical protein